jgi:hypothetical protein
LGLNVHGSRNAAEVRAGKQLLFSMATFTGLAIFASS